MERKIIVRSDMSELVRKFGQPDFDKRTFDRLKQLLQSVVPPDMIGEGGRNRKTIPTTHEVEEQSK